MHRNERRAAREAKRFTAYGIEHITDGVRAGGNHLVAQNDEPEPGRCTDCVVTGGECQPADKPLCTACRGLAATFAGAETATEYAQRRARENDRRALDLQLNGSGRLW